MKSFEHAIYVTRCVCPSHSLVTHQLMCAAKCLDAVLVENETHKNLSTKQQPNEWQRKKSVQHFLIVDSKPFDHILKVLYRFFLPLPTFSTVFGAHILLFCCCLCLAAGGDRNLSSEREFFVHLFT